MPASRKVRLCIIELPAKLGITQGQALNEDNIRQYCARKKVTLPDCIEIDAMSQDNGDWRIEIWENPDTDDKQPSNG